MIDSPITIAVQCFIVFHIKYQLVVYPTITIYTCNTSYRMTILRCFIPSPSEKNTALRVGSSHKSPSNPPWLLGAQQFPGHNLILLVSFITLKLLKPMFFFKALSNHYITLKSQSVLVISKVISPKSPYDPAWRQPRRRLSQHQRGRQQQAAQAAKRGFATRKHSYPGDFSHGVMEFYRSCIILYHLVYTLWNRNLTSWI